MLRFLAQMGTHYQEEIKLSSSVNPTTKLVEIPAQTVFPILPVPEAKISDYSGVQYSPMLSDTYKKAGNSYTSASPLASSDDYIEGSLKE